MAELLFYVLGALAVAAGVGVVLAKSPMISVLSLLGTFFCLAVIYLLAGFQFLAAAQVLVYAGAILVLFLFVIMLLNLGDLRVQFYLKRSLLGPAARVALALSFLLALLGAVAVRRSAVGDADPALRGEALDAMQPLALALFGRWSLAFEAVSLLLVATMVAVILLAKRERVRRLEGEA